MPEAELCPLKPFCSVPLQLLASSPQVYRGSVKEFPGFDASQDAEALYNAMKGFGTDGLAACQAPWLPLLFLPVLPLGSASPPAPARSGFGHGRTVMLSLGGGGGESQP